MSMRGAWVLVALLMAGGPLAAQRREAAPRPEAAVRRSAPRSEASPRARWERLDEAQRRRIEERWHRFRSLPPAEREALERRLKVLRRLPAVRESKASPREALHREIRRIRQRLGPGRSEDPKVLRRALEKRTLRRVDAFLDSLLQGGRLKPAERRRLAGLPPRARVREGLALMKREALALEAPDADRLADLDPVDLAAELHRRRREHGLLGATGRLLRLSREERQEIARALDAGRPERALKKLRPRVRRLLHQRGMKEAEIRRVLSLPLGQMERALHRMLQPR